MIKVLQKTNHLNCNQYQMVPCCDHLRFGIRGETFKPNELQQPTNSENPKDRLTADDLRIRGEWLLPTQAANPTLKAILKITLLSQTHFLKHSSEVMLGTRSIKVMLLVMYLRTRQFHHLQHPDLDLKDERIKSELTGKLVDAPLVILLQNTTSSHIFPKTLTAKFVAETNQPELLVGHQRPQGVMLSLNPRHSETLSPPTTKS